MSTGGSASTPYGDLLRSLNEAIGKLTETAASLLDPSKLQAAFDSITVPGSTPANRYPSASQDKLVGDIFRNVGSIVGASFKVAFGRTGPALGAFTGQLSQATTFLQSLKPGIIGGARMPAMPNLISLLARNPAVTGVISSYVSSVLPRNTTFASHMGNQFAKLLSPVISKTAAGIFNLTHATQFRSWVGHPLANRIGMAADDWSTLSKTPAFVAILGHRIGGAITASLGRLQGRRAGPDWANTGLNVAGLMAGSLGRITGSFLSAINPLRLIFGRHQAGKQPGQQQPAGQGQPGQQAGAGQGFSQGISGAFRNLLQAGVQIAGAGQVFRSAFAFLRPQSQAIPQSFFVRNAALLSSIGAKFSTLLPHGQTIGSYFGTHFAARFAPQIAAVLGKAQSYTTDKWFKAVFGQVTANKIGISLSNAQALVGTPQFATVVGDKISSVIKSGWKALTTPATAAPVSTLAKVAAGTVAVGAATKMVLQTAGAYLMLGQVARGTAENLNESNRRLSHWNYNLALAFRELAVGDYYRNLRMARDTQLTGSNLARNVNVMRNAWLGWDTFMQNTGNRIGSFAAGFSEVVGNIFSGIGRVGDSVMNYIDPTGNVAKNAGKWAAILGAAGLGFYLGAQWGAALGGPVGAAAGGIFVGGLAGLAAWLAANQNAQPLQMDPFSQGLNFRVRPGNLPGPPGVMMGAPWMGQNGRPLRPPGFVPRP